MSLESLIGRRFDYIIVGGGSAGCVLASRLSERPRNQVLLVEAGVDMPPGQEPEEILLAKNIGSALAVGDKYIWPGLEVNLVSGGGTPYPHRALYEQARVLGGGSSINVMAANRGVPRDYDEWEMAGAEGWGWEGILPYFRKLERDLEFDGPLHGKTGPIPIDRESYASWPPFVVAAAAALQASGLRDIGDQNGQFVDGFFRPSQSNENKLRVSTARGYLDAEVRRRQNLLILTETFVEKIIFSGNRATGVVVTRDNWVQEILAEREVVLTAGALQSPALLLRAGIGPAKDLFDLGIAILADRPGVGANLLDHPSTLLFSAIPPETGVSPNGDSRHGLAVRLSSGLEFTDASDLFLVVGAGTIGPSTATFGLWVNKPSSKGKITLRDVNPRSYPDVDFNLLSDARDLQRIRSGFNFISQLTRQRNLAEYDLRIVGLPTRFSFSSPAVNPPPPVTLTELLADDQILDSYLRRSVKGLWHASGTARLGRLDDVFAVVDKTGRVYGVEGLRVADASLFPTIPAANINLPTIATAEKIAASILAD